MIKVIKKNVGFRWGKEQDDSFNMLKSKLISTPILILSNFDKTFEMECDAFEVGIRAILM